MGTRIRDAIAHVNVPSLLHFIAIVLIAFSVTTAAVTALPSPRSQPATASPPVQVFAGERLDISAVELTGGGTIGTESVTLAGVKGDANGLLEPVSNPTRADFGGYATGTYRVASDDDDGIEFVVTEPRLGAVTIRNRNGANVTNAWNPTGTGLRVTAEYSFDNADRLDVTVRDTDGFSITNDVTSSPRITTSGGTVQIDLGGYPDGVYEIEVEGNKIGPSRTVTVRIGPRETATSTPTRTPTRTPTPTATPTVTTQTPTTPQPTTATPAPTTISTTTTARPTTDSTPTATTASTAMTTDASGPGFGSPVALLVVVLFGGWLSRRD